MYEISKVRNEIRFTREDGKYWFIDINDCSMHGISGKVVKNFPAGGRKTVEEYINNARWRHNNSIISVILDLYMDDYNSKIIGMVERLIVATGNADYSRYWSCYRENSVVETCTYTDAQLINALREMIRNHNRDDYRFTWNLYDVITYIDNNQMFGKEGKYAKLVDSYGEDIVKDYYNEFKNYNICSTNINWLERALKYRFNDEMMTRYIDAGLIDAGRIKRMIREMFEWCGAMEIKLPKGDFINEYNLLMNNYNIWKNRAKNEAFSKVQNQFEEFSYGDYVAIFPTTVEELVIEGNAQRNCLGGYWLTGYGNSEREFRRGACFVRKADNRDKPLITCDFYAGNGQIDQYYYACNERVSDKGALEFKDELQKYLTSVVSSNSANRSNMNFYF